MKNWCRILALPAALTVITSAGMAQSVNSSESISVVTVHPGTGILNLAVGDVNVADLQDLALTPPVSYKTGEHYVIQFNTPMTAEIRKQLINLGVKFGDYLPTNAFIVDLAQADPAALARLDYIDWIGEYQPQWKIAPGIDYASYSDPQRQELANRGEGELIVTLFEGEPAGETIKALENMNGVDVLRSFSIAGNMTLHVKAPLYLLNSMAELPGVQFIENAPEIEFRNNSNRWIVQSNITNVTPLYDAGIHGEGQVIGVLDGKLDRNHCSFSDTNPIGPTHRKILAYNTSAGADSHGTHVCGTAVGDAFTDANTRGVAYLGKLVFDDIPGFGESAVYNTLTQHHNQGARVHTNSWGNDGTTAYDSLARGFDSFLYDHEESMVTLAVTNTSSLKNPENAKNLLAVGASQDTPNQNQHCSGGAGPTSDGRRKPEIYAPGCGTISSRASTSCSTISMTGTSMASPAVAGTGMLVRQYYTDGYYPSGAAVPADAFTPSGALVKATLLNSAVDMTGVSGYPSNLEGWGRVLADEALHFTGETRALVVSDFFNADGLSTGDSYEQTVNVNSNGEKLKITMVFTDPPAAAGAAFAAINDLDLEVISPGGTTYLGNVFSGGVSVPGGSSDIRNNVEQVHIASPETGLWTIRVDATAVNQGTQGFALVISGDVDIQAPAFRISLPNGAPDVLEPGVATSFPVQITPGDETIVPGSEQLFYRYDGGSFISSPLLGQGGDMYLATLPPAACSDMPEFYVQAQGSGGTVLTDPPNAPAGTFSAMVGTPSTPVDDDMETDQGWTVGAPDDDATTGIWNRMDPEATEAQPEDDHTPAPGTMCWVTDGRAGSGLGTYDVDSGKTTLFSPVYDLSQASDPTISYWRWFSNNTGSEPNADVFVIDISNDGGNTWVNVETVGPDDAESSGGWFSHEFRAADFITLTSQVQLRFIASDEGGGSIVEAAVDDLLINDFTCDDASCPGDLNGDQMVDQEDLGILLSAYLLNADGDLDGDGDTDQTDLGILLSFYGTTCN